MTRSPDQKAISAFSIWFFCFKKGIYDIILDPFVGSGTTCIAAKMLGRRYIGFDDDEGYIEIAQCRLGAVEAVLI